MKIIFSPALYCKSNELYDLFLLNDTLDFIVKYLDGSLDDYAEAFYSDDRLFLPPLMKYANEIMQYTAITTNLFKLKTTGENILVATHNIQYQLMDSSYNVVNNNEFQIIVDYLQQLYVDNKLRNILFFTDNVNDSYNNKHIDIEINGQSHAFPIVGDLMNDESGNFNHYIKSTIGKEYKIFKCRDLCANLIEKINSNRSSGRNGALYKRYGKIIALRNRFELYYPKKPFEKDTHYFISHDKQYIISIDLKHGHYEIFDNTNRQLWIAKYKFSGEVISEPTDPEILKSEREDHKVEE